MTTQIRNVQIFNTEKRCFEPGSLWFREGKILEAPALPNTVIDAEGGYALPGLIDVHTHGRCGIDIMEADETALSALSLAYAESGVTTVFPTVMTAPLSKLENAIQKIKAAEYTADFAGIHIEGPYISKKKPGCHDIRAIRHPDKDEIFLLCERILPLFPHLTIAPEEDTDGVIRDFCTCFGGRGGTVAVGHTDADFDTAMRALSDGASAFTHTFNAMTPLLHRAPGAAGAALYADAYAEFICDGIHVDPAVIRIAYAAKRMQGDKFVLITDSIPAAGLADGDYEMNGIPFTLRAGKAAREDGTIVGSALDLFTAVKNLAKFADIRFEDALICATKAPAQMVGIYESRGSLEAGKRADILLCDREMNLHTVFCAGKKLDLRRSRAS